MGLTKSDIQEALSDLLVKIENDVEDTMMTLTSKLDPPPPPSPVEIRFANHRYFGSGPKPPAAIYEIQHESLPMDDPIFHTSETYRHVTTMLCRAEPKGINQFLPPDQVSDSWRLSKAPLGGGFFYRHQNGGEYLLDPGNRDWLGYATAVSNLERLTDGYDGLYIDEIDQTPFSGYPGAGSIDLSRWQIALSTFVYQVGLGLHSLGKKLWVNLGADFDLAVPWQGHVVEGVDGVNMEFFVARAGVGLGPATDTDWSNQVRFLADVEASGRSVHAHASGVYRPYTDYAFLSWLLGTQFHGSFSGSLDYSGQLYLPTADLVVRARQLGRPDGQLLLNSDGSVSRNFERGKVVLNRTSRDGVQGLTHLTGRIDLT